VIDFDVVQVTILPDSNAGKGESKLADDFFQAPNKKPLAGWQEASTFDAR